MRKKTVLWSAFAACLAAVAAVQFIPPAPLLVPVELPAAERPDHRLLNFEGIANFRDLGGYPAADGRRVKWGVLYRSGTLAHASDADIQRLARLDLTALIDFRSAPEKVEEPNRLPQPTPFDVVEIPTLDTGNQALVGQIMARIDSGDFDDFDADGTMRAANRQFATGFTPQFRRFIRTVLQADGAPIVWHCTAGKDRTGYAAAILLRMLGVADAVIMRDYLASNGPARESRETQLLMLRLFKGQETADNVAVLMGVRAAWLQAGLDEIERHWGSFDAYVRDGLGLEETDLRRLRANLLTAAPPPV